MNVEEKRVAALDMYRDGHTYRQISQRLNLSNETIGKYVKHAGLKPRARHAAKPRPVVSCRWCGVSCRSPRHECWECYLLRLGRPVENPVGLHGGQWVPRGGIVVWQPDYDEQDVA